MHYQRSCLPLQFLYSACLTRLCQHVPVSGPRRSYPTDDLELLSSSGKPLPAVRSPTRGLISADSIPAAQSSTNLSSVTSVFSSSPGEGSGAIGVWVGDPEAISSVRRPRKSVSRQRLEHQWNRSQSLKERPSSSRSELSVRSSVSRSHSMRENARRSPQTARGEVAGVNDPKRKVSRSRSLKDGGAEKIEECLSAIDLGASYPTSGIKRQMSLRMLSRREMKSGLVENPESKSRVWAYLISEPPTTDPSSSTIAMRRRKLTGTHMKINPTISLEKTSPLPPISPGHLTAGPAYDTDRFSSGESAQSTPPRSPKDLVHVTPSSTPERKLSDQLIPPRVSRTGSLKGSSGSTRTRKLGVSMASGSALLGPDTVSSRRDDPETNRDPGPEKEREISVCVTGSEEG